MKYIFFFNRIVDIDHLLPIAYSLYEYSNVEYKNIIFTQVRPDTTINNKISDKRILYLKSLGVKIFFLRSNFIYSINQYLKKKSNLLFFKIIFFFIIRFLDVMINIYEKILLNSINRKYKEKFKLITPTFGQNLLKKYRKLYKNIKIYGVHIGVPLRNMYDREIKEIEKILEQLDYYFFCSSNTINNNSYFKANKNKIISNVSARYNLLWIDKLKLIYNISDSNKNKKINVVMFLEKEYFRKKSNILYNDYIKVIKYLSQHNDINFIVKSHPSMIAKKSIFHDIDNDNINLIVDDNFITSYELVNTSDLIICSFSSVILDAYLLKKNTVLLDLFNDEKIEIIFEKFLKSGVCKNFNSFKEYFTIFLQDSDKVLNYNRNDVLNCVLPNYKDNSMKIISNKITSS